MSRQDILYLCPICGEFFDGDVAADVHHCLGCDHHYPPDRGNRCHNCNARLSKIGKAVRTQITGDDLVTILEWDRKHRRPRGTWELWEPDGRHFVGGVQMTP